MVELFENTLVETDRQSSKGNQLKWEDAGTWYKADYTGYEGLSEYIVSGLLKKSSLSPEEYVLYESEQIHYKSVIYNGCKSMDFSGDCQIITVERLFKNQYGRSLNAGIYALKDVRERLKYMVDQIERMTGIKEFGVYISKLLTIDALFLNEDRHTHNISVLMDGRNGFKLCPIYDNGAALMSDITMDYPMGADVYDLIKTVRTKTLCDSFEEQLDAAEELYGRNVEFYWDEKDASELLNAAEIYGVDIRDRVRTILLEQRRKYSYLFK